MPVVERHSRFDLRDLIQVDTFPVDITDEEELALRVVDNMNSIVRAEVLQNRNDDGTVGDGRQIDCYPVGVVLSHESHLVALFQPTFLKQDMQLLNVDCQLSIRQRYIRSVVGHGFSIPVLPERAFVHLDEIVFFFSHHKPNPTFESRGVAT